MKTGRILRRALTTTGFLAIGIAVAGAFWVHDSSGGPQGFAGYWELRAQLEGACPPTDDNIVCAEWCVEGGAGTGTFCCLPTSEIGSTNPRICTNPVAP